MAHKTDEPPTDAEREKFGLADDREWLIQMADALDAAERVYPNLIQMSDGLARQTAARLRAISEVLPND